MPCQDNGIEHPPSPLTLREGGRFLAALGMTWAGAFGMTGVGAFGMAVGLVMVRIAARFRDFLLFMVRFQRKFGKIFKKHLTRFDRCAIYNNSSRHKTENMEG